MSCAMCGRSSGHASWCINSSKDYNDFEEITKKRQCSACGGTGKNISCYTAPDPFERLEEKLGWRFPCKVCNGTGMI